MAAAAADLGFAPNSFQRKRLSLSSTNQASELKSYPTGLGRRPSLRPRQRPREPAWVKPIGAPPQAGGRWGLSPMLQAGETVGWAWGGHPKVPHKGLQGEGKRNCLLQAPSSGRQTRAGFYDRLWGRRFHACSSEVWAEPPHLTKWWWASGRPRASRPAPDVCWGVVAPVSSSSSSCRALACPPGGSFVLGGPWHTGLKGPCWKVDRI